MNKTIVFATHQATRTLITSVSSLLLAALTVGCDEDVDDKVVDTAEVEDTGTVNSGADADEDGYDDKVDCDDNDATVHPEAADEWYDGVDSDCAGDDDYDADLDGYDRGIDCDESDAETYPTAPDAWYDGVDSDCEGNNDFDADGDGFETAEHGGTDCDDTDVEVNPDARDVWYDGIDSDCAGNNDYDADDDGVDAADHGGSDCDDTDADMYPGAPDAWYDGVDSDCVGDDDYDADADGFGLDTDCDDTDPTIYPGAPDAAFDGLDSDCAGDSDQDGDGDGYDVADDCDDGDATIYPGAPEVWYDAVDSDCAGDGDNDQDGDGYDLGVDCDDTDPTIYPGAPDAWYDGVDSDCAGNNDNDQDADGHVNGWDCDDTDATINTAATEVWYDGVDTDCLGDNDFDADGDGYDVDADCDDTNALVFPDEFGLCDTLAPYVVATSPEDGDENVGVSSTIYAYFSENIDPLTVTVTSFTLEADGIPVLGLISGLDDTATFEPLTNLTGATFYTAEITTDVTDIAGNPMSVPYSWSFSTEITTAGVNLGVAGDFAILAKTGISTVPDSAITGDIGVSPAAATFITGFSLIADATNVFSTSPQVVGNVYAADYAVPTPARLTTAVLDMEAAFTDAAGRAPTVTELGAGDIGGMTLSPGVYKWGTGVLIPTDITLEGSETGVWIFEIAQDLTLANGVKVMMAGGALPQNVTWQVAGLVDIGTTAHIEGVVLCQTGITLATGATANGRLLAQSAVVLDANTVVEPAE